MGVLGGMAVGFWNMDQVLFYDGSGDGLIAENRDYVDTEWASSTTSVPTFRECMR